LLQLSDANHKHMNRDENPMIYNSIES
jgi:hypothetical protein